MALGRAYYGVCVGCSSCRFLLTWGSARHQRRPDRLNTAGRIALQHRAGEAQHPPTQHGRRVQLLSIAVLVVPPAARRPLAPIDLDGEPLVRPGEIKAPAPAKREYGFAFGQRQIRPQHVQVRLKCALEI